MNREEKRKFDKELKALAVPLALQGLLNALVGASDALMLGRLSQEAIGAVSLANQVTFIMTLFVGGITGAAGVLIAQYYGKKDYVNAKRFMSMALRHTLVINLIFFTVTFFAPVRIMQIFTMEEEMIRIGAGYLRIVSFSYLFSGFSQCYLAVMKIDGRAKISVWISAITVIVDMVMDFFLIYGYGKIPALGANGTAYSTIAVEAIALIWCIVDSYQKDHMHPNLESLCFFSGEYESDMWKIAIPMLASGLSWGLSISMHSLIIGHLGTAATAAYSVSELAKQLIQCIAFGIGHGSGIMIGGLLGQNKLDEAKKYGDRFWKVSFWCGIANAALLCIVGPLVYFFYVLEPLAKQYLIVMLVYSTVYLFAFAYNTIYTCGVFPAGGDARYDAISVCIATWLIAIPISLVGCFVFHWPVLVVYAVMCADEICKAPFLLWRYNKFIWLKNLTREA